MSRTIGVGSPSRLRVAGAGAALAVALLTLLATVGPAGATTSVVLQIYNSGFQSFRFGYSASISFLLFAGILVFTILQLKMFRFGTTPY